MLMTLLVAIVMMLPTQVLAATGTTKAINEKLGVPIVVYGANLSEAERELVKTALGVEEEPEFDEITVAGEDLVKYIKNSNASSRMYSSAKITRQEEGKGLVISIVTPENITQVTAEMYASAMLTAGIQDAIVEVAAPKAVTGHSALVGIYKAYEVKTGETLDIERTDVANEELSVATEIAENSGITEEQVANLLTEIKKSIAEQAPATKEEVQRIVEEQLTKLEINLSEQDRQLLIDLMDQIRNLNIDFSQWSEQLSDLSKTIEEKFGGLSDLVQDEGFWNGVKNFFTNLIDTIAGWFGSSNDSDTQTE
ncbi:DUF1002 domain-containing protein [Lysinibacillus sp. LZ02]|uniref:DUF1002 domain-containing protein n=1 Tax=Lysinibacillus sp. LZ02 TaxID=3420668 RepID=UPI003D36D35F